MEVGYTAVKGTFYLENHGDYTSYGLVCCSRSNCIRIIPDISTDASFVESMAQQFNTGKLASCHFFDAVIDQIL